MSSRKVAIAVFALALLLPCVSIEAMASTPAGNLFSLSTLSQEMDYKAKFEELPPEYRERARKLGYKEGDSVSCRRDASGNLVVLPPVEGNKSVEQMKAKLLQVLTEKVCKKVEMPLDVTATLNPDDLTGYFTVRVKGKNLKEEFQKQAEQQGLKKDDTIAVRVDAVSWEAKVAPRETSFAGRLIKVIPPTEAGGKPTFIAAAKFDDLPPTYQKSAAEKGYRKGEEVMMEDKGTGSGLEVMPRSTAAAMPKPAKTFRLGIRSSYAELNKKEQEKARKLGYKEGDTVWSEVTDKGKSEILSPADVGNGPDTEILGGEFNPSTQELILQGITTFEKLGPDAMKQALAWGYKPGDTVGVRVSKTKASVMSPSETRQTIREYEQINKQRNKK